MMDRMKGVQPRLTHPELRLMPDEGKRYELIDGDFCRESIFLVAMAGCDAK
jgi:hypothetical protein